jgi:hypothetical protein
VRGVYSALFLASCSLSVSLEGLSGGPADSGTADAGAANDGGPDSAGDATADGDAAPRPISLLQHTSIDLGNAGVTSGSHAFTAPVVQGNLLVVGVKMGNVGATIRDSLGSAWTVVNPSKSSIPSVQSWYAKAQSTGPNTVTIEFDATTTYTRFVMFEYEGVSALEDHAEGADMGGTASAGSVTLRPGPTLLWAFCDEGLCQELPPMGFTLRESPGSGAGCNLAADQVVDAGGTYPVTCRLSNSSDGWATVVAAFK